MKYSAAIALCLCGALIAISPGSIRAADRSRLEFIKPNVVDSAWLWSHVYYTQSPLQKGKYQILVRNYEESKRFLPIWEESFMRLNLWSQSYFDKHIRILTAGIDTAKWEGRNELRFTISYDYVFDWVRLRCVDRFVVGVDSALTTLKVEDIVNSSGPGMLVDANFSRPVLITRVRPSTTIASRKAIEGALKRNCSNEKTTFKATLSILQDGSDIVASMRSDDSIKPLCAEYLLFDKKYSGLSECPEETVIFE